MLSPKEKRDKIVRSTDLDALSCRLSANSKGYFSPPDPYIDVLVSSYEKYLRYTHGYTNLSAGRTIRSSFKESKLPIINNGTYLRTKAIDLIVEKVVSEFDNAQIISLGGGSDTRAFRLLKSHPSKNLKYLEIDFADSCRIKKLAILNNTDLGRIVNCKLKESDPASVEEFQNFDGNYRSTNYNLLGLDLRKLSNPSSTEVCELLEIVDKLRPTLILSECVLCYLSEEQNTDVVRFWVNTLQNTSPYISFLNYEPMSLNDVFGDTMASNLASRGINLMTFQKQATVDSKIRFFTKAGGLQNALATDIATVGGYSGANHELPWISDSERTRIRQLELIDEVEEIILLFKHYCICFSELALDGTGTLIQGLSKLPWLSSSIS